MVLSYNALAKRAEEQAIPLTQVSALDFASLLGNVFTPGSEVLSVYREDEGKFRSAQKSLQFTGCDIPKRQGAFWDRDYITIETHLDGDQRLFPVGVSVKADTPSSIYAPVVKAGKVVGVYIREGQSGNSDGKLVERLLLLSNAARPRSA